MKHSALNKYGPQAAAWMEARNEFLQRNPSNHEGYWVCHYCGKWLTIEQLTVDHKDARSRRPDKRTDQSNLVACCKKCNGDKGSRSEEEFKRDKGLSFN